MPGPDDPRPAPSPPVKSPRLRDRHTCIMLLPPFGSMSSPHEFTIPIRDLDAGGRDASFPVRTAWLRTVLEGTEVAPAGGDGTLELRVSKSGTDVVVHGKLVDDLVVPCGRCLEPARVEVREDIGALAVPRAQMREAGHTSEDGDPMADSDDVLPYDGETVVLDDLVRDDLLLAVPMIPLCSEACKGISRPSHSGDEPEAAGIDPRLRPLLRLKKTTP